MNIRDVTCSAVTFNEHTCLAPLWPCRQSCLEELKSEWLLYTQPSEVRPCPPPRRCNLFIHPFIQFHLFIISPHHSCGVLLT